MLKRSALEKLSNRPLPFSWSLLSRANSSRACNLMRTLPASPWSQHEHRPELRLRTARSLACLPSRSPLACRPEPDLRSTRELGLRRWPRPTEAHAELAPLTPFRRLCQWGRPHRLRPAHAELTPPTWSCWLRPPRRQCSCWARPADPIPLRPFVASTPPFCRVSGQGLAKHHHLQ
jgi:hypothetical protein